MPVTTILWSHALAALLFGSVALIRWRDAESALPRRSLVLALALTALWSLAVAGIDMRDVTTRLMEPIRDLGWLGFMYLLAKRRPGSSEARSIALLYGAVALLVLVSIIVVLGDEVAGHVPALVALRAMLRAMIALGALLLVHHLHLSAPAKARGGLRLVIIALAAMWGTDLLLYGTTYWTGRVSADLIAAHGIAMIVAALLLAVAVQRGGDWTLQLSRMVAWQTLSILGALLYGAMMLLATGAIARVGGDNARLWQTAFVFGSTAAVLTLVASPWVRAWGKVKLAKHFFSHRYDYRAEWVRFTETLGRPDDAAPLDERIVKAVADLTDSPAGLLLVPDGTALGIGAGWNWDRTSLPVSGADEPLATWLATSGRIVELDAVRRETATAEELACVPLWMLDTDGWALIPLVHLGNLQGGILLARPPVDRALDWEDLDLLRIAGRQVASYLAEARAQEALSEAQRFDEFNRRFAFIMHDIKNLVSQLTLVARNAERHADNPAFRADMIATLQDSVGRMNHLLARLSQHHSGHVEPLREVEILPLADAVAARRRTQHPVAIVGARDGVALADPVRLEQVLGHLLQNAIEASPEDEPVTISLSGDAAKVVIDVIDRGCGMSPAFVRDQLFKPFVSSKPGGFGIGAFEARQLAEAMGGSVSVTSREGEGSHFRVTLRAAHAPALFGKAA